MAASFQNQFLVHTGFIGAISSEMLDLSIAGLGSAAEGGTELFFRTEQKLRRSFRSRRVESSRSRSSAVAFMVLVSTCTTFRRTFRLVSSVAQSSGYVLWSSRTLRTSWLHMPRLLSLRCTAVEVVREV